MEVTRPHHRLANLSDLLLLVVDDDPDALTLLVSLLEGHGAKVVAARSASEALDALQQTRPDVIVSDIGMPGEDGYSLIERVRALPEQLGGFTPAIAVTAFNQEHDRRRALTAGFWRHLPKPVDKSLLCAEISRLARGQASVRQPA
jgi:CheY-like chemotaxis protein